MRRALTPEQRTLLTDLIAAELVRARSAALAAGTAPVDVRRAVAVRIIALTAHLDRVRDRL